MMGNNFHQIKIGLYVLVIAIVGTLFGVRVYNAWQRTNYTTKTIFENGDVQITLSYPAKILSPKNDASYPLTLAFYYTGVSPSPHTYEIFLQSPTLLFVDAKGDDVIPRFQFTNGYASMEQGVYVRPYLSETYPLHHVIDIETFTDGQEVQNLSTPIEIQTEPWLLSFFSLAAASLLEVSIASALIGWAANAIDASLSARKEQVAKIHEALNSLSSLTYLEQMEKVCKLDSEIKDEHLNDDLGDEIESAKNRFNEREFFRALGEQLRRSEDKALDSKIMQRLHTCYFKKNNHEACIGALGNILSSDAFPAEEIFPLMSAVIKLWDDFDADAKDLIINTLRRFSQKCSLSSLSVSELSARVFTTSNRRRLLRDAEIEALFPRFPVLLPLGYDAKWRHYSKPAASPEILDWLKKFTLVLNPFGVRDLKNHPFYPEGCARPDNWTDCLNPIPQLVQCPTPEDAKALGFQLRTECLPAQQEDAKGNETVISGLRVFPIWVSFNRSSTIESPLLTIARSAAQTWLDILYLSPDAFLDLLPVEQEALLEMLSWSFGSTSAVINLLKRAGLKPVSSGDLLVQKIEQFKSGFPSTQLPQDAILLSWLNIKPPDLNSCYIIILLDEIPVTAKIWWLEQLKPLITTLFLHGIVIKAFSSLHIPPAFPLSGIRLDWSDLRLKKSLDGQFGFSVAIDKETNRREKEIKINELFGPFGSVSEKNTTAKLISASHNSLALMLTLGNRLLQYHCEHRTKDEVSEKYLYVEDLETILNTV